MGGGDQPTSHLSKGASITSEEKSHHTPRTPCISYQHQQRPLDANSLQCPIGVASHDCLPNSNMMVFTFKVI